MNSIWEKSPNAVSEWMPCLQVVDLRHRELGVLGADAPGGLPDVDQPVFVAIGERPQQHAADHAEDRGVGADAERQGQHHGERPVP